MRVVGLTEENKDLLVTRKTQEGNLHLSLHPLPEEVGKPRLFLNLSELEAHVNVEVTHVALQNLLYDDGAKSNFFLLAISQRSIEDCETIHLASIILVEDKEGKMDVLDEIEIVQSQSQEPRLFFLPFNNKAGRNGDGDNNILNPIASFKSRILLLSLQECIMVLEAKVTPYKPNSAKIEILSESECIVKSKFWFSQWSPNYNYLAYAHTKKRHQSNFEDEDHLPQKLFLKPMLSVLQFHEQLPRESVLNLPLDVDFPKIHRGEIPIFRAKLNSNPMVLCPSSIQLRVLAHSSGAVVLFRIHPQVITAWDNSSFTYSLNLLHRNKTLTAKVSLGQYPKTSPVNVDVAMFQNGQFVVVVGWPLFINIHDVGTSHEPSHHLLFEWTDLMPNPEISKLHFLCSTCPPKDLNSQLYFVFDDNSSKKLNLTSSLLIQLCSKFSAKLPFKLSTLHYLLYHQNEINAAKRLIYDSGKRSGENIHLKNLFQEFLIASAFMHTRKQLMSNMEDFLYFIPYSPYSDLDWSSLKVSIKLEENNGEVLTVLLSRSQRVFPHNVTDIWTSLWEFLHEFAKVKRFSHNIIAEKLILSLQCYKPEALSRASTPMSPSSPMICSTMTEIATLFLRRTQELQLPFVEHESCTANKQEYVFSINLRELSMYLLKERKDWPLHGHTVAGKYVSSLVESARLLCHLACLTVNLQPSKTNRGFRLIDSLEWSTKVKLFMLLEHYSLALGSLACPLPQGYAPFFAYLGYRVLNFEQYLWHVRSGTFELQIDLVKMIMSDLSDSDDNVAKKFHLISLLPKSRANRVLNGWSHPKAICIRARQHSSDLLSGTASSQMRKNVFITQRKKKGKEPSPEVKERASPLDTFFQLLKAKANPSDIDMDLLREATINSLVIEEDS